MPIISMNSWCHRIFPIQETCLLTEKNIKVVVSKLVQEYLGNEQDRLDGPIKVILLSVYASLYKLLELTS